jgi:hypothetical protein
MSKDIWELKMCSNGLYYVWKDNDLYLKNNGEYIIFDDSNRENATDLINILNNQEKRINELENANSNDPSIVTMPVTGKSTWTWMTD